MLPIIRCLITLVCFTLCLVISLSLNFSPPPHLLSSSLPECIPLGINETHSHTEQSEERKEEKKRKSKSASKRQNKRLRRHLGEKRRNQESRQRVVPRLRSRTVCFASCVDAATPFSFSPVWLSFSTRQQAASRKLDLHGTPPPDTLRTPPPPDATKRRGNM